MDAIEALDYGVYAHFAHMSKQPPDLSNLMQPAGYLSSYVAVSLLIVVAIALFLRQGNRRSALITAVDFLLAVGVIQIVRFAVPRLAPGGARGSYPSAGVYLFMLSMILLGSAVWQLAQRWQRAAVVAAGAVLTIWVCVGELYLSIQWLTDIIGGLAGATIVGWTAIRFMNVETSKADEFS